MFDCRNLLFITALVVCTHYVSAYHSWSLLATIQTPEAGNTYAESKSFVTGRGFQTMQTGFRSDPPALFVHTNDEGHDVLGKYVWSQQAILVPEPPVPPSAMFGKWVISFNHTIITTAPFSTEFGRPAQGSVYIYNGTRRHWTQLQKLTVPEAAPNSRLGVSMAFRGDRLVVGAPGFDRDTGAAVVFTRPYEGAKWSRSDILQARDGYPMTVLSTLQAGGATTHQHVDGSLFAESISLHDEYLVASARHDDLHPFVDDIHNTGHLPPNNRTGSVFVFQNVGRWSQQQKLVAQDFQHLRYWEVRNHYAGREKRFGYDLALTEETLAVTVKRVDGGEEKAQQSVRTYSPMKLPTGYSRWSVQQRLILDCCDYEVDLDDRVGVAAGLLKTYPISKTMLSGAKIHVGDDLESFFVTMLSSTNQSQFVFTSGRNPTSGYKSWSMQQVLQTNIPHTEEVSNYGSPIYTQPSQMGGTLMMHSNNDTVEVLSKYHNGSCMVLWMSDHFGDGWDSLVLTVRAPDTTNDSFSPKCDQIDPFRVRYCPYHPTDEGVYIVKPFASEKARFFWEVSWQVQLESTGVWYKGDANTRFLFNFDSDTLEFSFVGSTNPLTIEKSPIANNLDVQPCFRCHAVTTKSWLQLQDLGDFSFWSFVAYGGPYWISDVEARTVYFSGRVCDGVAEYECYQTLPSGQYIMRMGGGHFGRIIGSPYQGAWWRGCGTSGGWQDQLIFEVKNQQCRALQVFRYNSTCSVPPPVVGLNSDAAFGTLPGSTPTPGPAPITMPGRRRLTAEGDAEGESTGSATVATAEDKAAIVPAPAASKQEEMTAETYIAALTEEQVSEVQKQRQEEAAKWERAKALKKQEDEEYQAFMDPNGFLLP